VVPALTDVFHILEEETKIESEYVTEINSCGYWVDLKFYSELGYTALDELYDAVPWLHNKIKYFLTDPTMPIETNEKEKRNDDDFDYLQSPVMDRFSVHMHRVSDKFGYKSMQRQNSNATINFPLINCDERSVTSWYKLLEGEPFENGFISRVEDCEFELLETTSLHTGQPNILRTDRWHDIINHTGKKRVIANWDFWHYVLWDDIPDIIEPYTKDGNL